MFQQSLKITSECIIPLKKKKKKNWHIFNVDTILTWRKREKRRDTNWQRYLTLTSKRKSRGIRIKQKWNGTRPFHQDFLFNPVIFQAEMMRRSSQEKAAKEEGGASSWLARENWIHEREREREKAVHFNSRFLNLLSLASIFTLALHFISPLGFLPFGKSLQDEYPGKPLAHSSSAICTFLHTHNGPVLSPLRLFIPVLASVSRSRGFYLNIFATLAQFSLALLSARPTVRAVRLYDMCARNKTRFLVFRSVNNEDGRVEQFSSIYDESRKLLGAFAFGENFFLSSFIDAYENASRSVTTICPLSSRVLCTRSLRFISDSIIRFVVRYKKCSKVWRSISVFFQETKNLLKN